MTWLDAHRRALTGVAAALLAMPVVLWAWSEASDRLPAELWVVRNVFNHANNATLSGSVNFFVGVGAVPIAFATVVFGALLVRRELGDDYALLVLAAAAAAPISRVLEAIFGPTPLYRAVVGPDADGNLPSGHAAYAAAVFGMLAFLALERGRRDLAAIAVIVIAGVGPALILRGSHLLADVLAGYALGFGWTLALLLVFLSRSGRPATG